MTGAVSLIGFESLHDSPVTTGQSSIKEQDMGRKYTTSADHTGDIGDVDNVISGVTGSVALNGEVHNNTSKSTGQRTVSGKDRTVVKGDNTETISRSF